MKNIIIFTTLISFCSVFSRKGYSVYRDNDGHMWDIDTKDSSNPIEDINNKLYNLKRSLGIDYFVQVPDEKEIENYKKLNPNPEIKPIEKDFKFETDYRRYKDSPSIFFNKYKLPSGTFSEFHRLYESNFDELAKRTMGLWVKIHEEYNKTNLRRKIKRKN